MKSTNQHAPGHPRISHASRWTRAFALLLVICGAGVAEAGVTILAPADGDTKVAAPCPFPTCSAVFAFQVQVTGAAVDTVSFVRTPDTGNADELVICQPPGQFDPTPGCPVPPVVISHNLPLQEGTWTVVARVLRGTQAEQSTPIRLTVLPSNRPPAGTISLSAVTPIAGAPRLLARDPGPDHPGGILTPPGETTISGRNLDNNPFLDVYASPIRPGEPPLAPDSPLPVGDWCRFPARILGRGALPGGESVLRVELPALPLEAPTTCGVPPGPLGSIFAKDWRWLIHDRWIRPERQHDFWAIPTPQALPWGSAPAFRMVKPAYPLIDGFGFVNKGTDPRYYEFLTVYGNNAYLCVGAFGLCATRVPDPLYHLLWWPIYREFIQIVPGSCNGMASTSLLLAREDLQTEAFSPDVHFPVGFDQPGDPATYADTDSCTPFCSPPRPANLWANIRMNHGVQLSREFLFQILDTLGEAIFDPNDLASIRGVPQATLERVAADPLGHVVCFFKPGGGHCVTPHEVNGTKMLIYDNNNPQDDTRFIEVVGGDYDYPARRNDNKEPNSGNAIMAFPIGIWKGGRHLLGLDELAVHIQGGIVPFLFMIAVGSGDITVTNDAGGRWGFEEDGSFTDSLRGALALPPLGPPTEEGRAMPLLVAMNQPPPTVQMNAKGGRYLYMTGAGGHLLQLEASDALAGDKDLFQVGYEGAGLASFEFTPQRAASHFVPRVGLAIGEEESALFHWLGLTLPAGRNARFGADKLARAVTYTNSSGAPTHHMLALDHGSGSAGTFGRMIYGPFEVPDGARQRVVLASWPDVATVVSELDFDRDGRPDHREAVLGRPASPPLGQEASADLSVSKTAAPTTLPLGESVTYTVKVANAGPDQATDVRLFDALPPHAVVSHATSTHGDCAPDSSGLQCALLGLGPGAEALVSYTVTVSLPGTLANGATVFGSDGDPDLTNNSAFATADVPVRVDVKPSRDPTVVRPGSHDRIPVAILGQPGFDVRRIDAASLRFGPAGAQPALEDCRPADSDDAADGDSHERRDIRRRCGRLRDVNDDGEKDLVSYFRSSATGIAHGDTTTCMGGVFLDGRSFRGCDAIRTTAEAEGEADHAEER
jgi:uncharacterized repeat protein (TIGR01451 family)